METAKAMVAQQSDSKNTVPVLEETSQECQKGADQQTPQTANRSKSWSLLLLALALSWQYADFGADQPKDELQWFGPLSQNWVKWQWPTVTPLPKSSWPAWQWPTDVSAVSGFDSLAMFGKIALLALVVVAVLEALRFPRQAAMRTWPDIARCALQLVGDILVTPVLIYSTPEVPELSFQHTEANRRILERCPSLKEFKQMAVFRNQLLALGALMVFDMVGADEKLFRRELLAVQGDGNVALDWWAAGDSLPSTANVLFVASTLTGDALTSTCRYLCRYFHARGWRCVVMTKRGCGIMMANSQPDKNTTPWCLGGFDDVEASLEHVATRFPMAKICGVGVSCGGGQLRHYVNKSGDASRLASAVIYDAADGWDSGLRNMDREQPLLSMVLAGAMGNALAKCGDKAKALAEARSFPWDSPMVSAAQLMGALHGFPDTPEGAEAYCRHCNPAPYADCRRPVLELTSFNDTLSNYVSARRIQQNYPAQSPNVIVAATKDGTHVIRWEGKFAECWTSRVAHEFFEAVLSSR